MIARASVRCRYSLAFCGGHAQHGIHDEYCHCCCFRRRCRRLCCGISSGCCCRCYCSCQLPAAYHRPHGSLWSSVACCCPLPCCKRNTLRICMLGSVVRHDPLGTWGYSPSARCDASTGMYGVHLQFHMRKRGAAVQRRQRRRANALWQCARQTATSARTAGLPARRARTRPDETRGRGVGGDDGGSARGGRTAEPAAPLSPPVSRDNEGTR